MMCLCLVEMGSQAVQSELYKVNDDHAEREGQTSASQWCAEPQVVQQSKVEKSEFIKYLDGETDNAQFDETKYQHWSDYTRLYYHPNTVNPINIVKPKRNYAGGYELSSSEQWKDDIVDGKFRSFAEECDVLKGLNVQIDLLEEFGGLSIGTLQEVRDDNQKLPIVSFCYDNYLDKVEGVHELSRFKTVYEARGLCDMINIVDYSRLETFDSTSIFVNSKLKSLYMRSAVCSMALDTTLLPFYTTTRPSSLSALFPLKSHMATMALSCEQEQEFCFGSENQIGRCFFSAKRVPDGKSVPVSEDEGEIQLKSPFPAFMPFPQVLASDLLLYPSVKLYNLKSEKLMWNSFTEPLKKLKLPTLLTCGYNSISDLKAEIDEINNLFS